MFFAEAPMQGADLTGLVLLLLAVLAVFALAAFLLASAGLALALRGHPLGAATRIGYGALATVVGSGLAALASALARTVLTPAGEPLAALASLAVAAVTLVGAGWGLGVLVAKKSPPPAPRP